eukprot:SAG31_NODE_5241_length_2656_cov_1.481424_4_plen_113_part_01
MDLLARQFADDEGFQKTPEMYLHETSDHVLYRGQDSQSKWYMRRRPTRDTNEADRTSTANASHFELDPSVVRRGMHRPFACFCASTLLIPARPVCIATVCIGHPWLSQDFSID